ncbi:unnamed protein product [Adineta steineri]|uniref:Phorbol-ester/DAG-type domain-containing protein n=1 Tax=Adineta steineri TaxID=433720 RepID=A0A815YQ04_9BILA|nr:unnamed protein product [Adineta steineri]CAF1670684.1 unnamed protein product [Adineta steineri]
MSFKRETQMTLNFQSPNTKQSNLKDYVKDPIRKNLIELSKHKNYDDNMAHGFVTVNIRHEPKIEKKLNHESEKEEISSMETIRIQNEPLTTINEEQESSSSKSTNHLFEDQPFSVGTCYFCSKTIWMKSARQCRTCLVTVHKKCEYKYNRESICTQESIRSKSAILEENQLIDDSDLTSNIDQTREKRSLTSSLIDTHSPVDTLIRHSGRIFGNKSPNRPSTIPGLLKHDEFDNSHTGKRSVSNPSSSKLVNAASSAYNKLLDFKTKRSTLESKKPRSSSVIENISEDDLQDIIKKCLSEENVDMTSLENLFHEKAVDRTALYAKVNKFGSELFLDLPLEERKQKLENEISRVQHEIELQNRIRDELILEYNDHSTDENRKKKIVAAIMKVDEKVQAFGALTLLYCTGFKHCCSPIEMTDIEQKSLISEKTDYHVEQARKQIKDWLNKPMRVSIIDGRVLVGVLLCTDRDQNLILGNCNEYIGSPSEQEEFRVLGLALIPGQHIQSIYIEEGPSSILSYSNSSHTSITTTNDHILDDDKSDG